jgi:hypothetical protein
MISSFFKQYQVKYRNILIPYLFLYALYIIFIGRNQWFFYDDFDFVSNNRISGSYISALLMPHNEHTALVPFVLFRLIYMFFGLSSYMPYFAINIIVLTTLFFVLYLFARLLKISSRIAFFGIIFLSFTPAYYENIFWAFQVGLSLSACFGFISLGLISASSRFNKYNKILVFGALMISVFSSSLGLIFISMSIIFILLNRSWKSYIASVVLPLIIWILWSVNFSSTQGLSLSKLIFTLNNYTQFMSVGVNEALTSIFSIASFGVIVVGVFIYLAFRLTEVQEQKILLAHILGLFLMWFLLTYGRASVNGEVNLNLATASRYTFGTIILLWIPTLMGIDKSLKEIRITYLAIPLGLVFILWGATTLNGRANQQEEIEVEIKTNVLNAVRKVHEGSQNTIFLEDNTPQLDQSDIQYFYQTGKLNSFFDK